jgi:hypothetical protein
LIRDNVQHLVENGIPSERFAALHEIESAVDGETCIVPAARLRAEVEQAWRALRGLRLRQAAVSLRTRAIMTNCPEKPNVRGTAPARQTGWELPVQADGAVEVCSAARSFFEAVSEVTASAAGGEHVTITLAGGRPRYASAPDASDQPVT